MIQATIDRFEENYAIVNFANGDTLSIHIDELPDDAAEGATLYFYPSLSEEMPSGSDKNEHLAKNILNEILKPHAN